MIYPVVANYIYSDGEVSGVNKIGVRHDVFGEGAIENIDVDRGAYMVRFDGMATPRMISFRAKMTAL